MGPFARHELQHVKEEADPGFTLAGFSRCFSWWHFKPAKMIAGDVHLRCSKSSAVRGIVFSGGGGLPPPDNTIPLIG